MTGPHRIAGAHWADLAGAADLADDGAFVTGRVEGVPVIVRNQRGTLRAFRNICTHRQALMEERACGRGVLRCPYHGWTFDGETGEPRGVPFDATDFHLDGHDAATLALAPLDVKVEGGRVLARLSIAPLAAPTPEGEMLPPRWFTEPARLEREWAVWRRRWLFAATLPDLAAGPLTLTLAGVALTLAPDLGVARADGGAARAERCGALVFVRLEDDGSGPSLADSLGPMAARLAALSAQCDQPVGEDALVFEANWKALVENTLDDFHGSTVHPDTIHPAVDPDWQNTLTTERFGANSRSTWRLSESTADWWRRVVAKGGLRRLAGADEGARYEHHFVFPNLYVAAFNDAMVIIHQVQPLAVGRSRLLWRTFLPLRDPADARAQAFRRALADTLARSARTVIEEDKPYCERTQKARVVGGAGAGRLGRRERRIADFHATLAEALDLSNPITPKDAPWA